MVRWSFWAMDNLGLVEFRYTDPLMCLTVPGIMEVDELVVCDSLWSRCEPHIWRRWLLALAHISPAWHKFTFQCQTNIIGLLKVILTIVTFACHEIVVVDLTCTRVPWHRRQTHHPVIHWLARDSWHGVTSSASLQVSVAGWRPNCSTILT